MTDESGSDEIFLMVNNRKIWPVDHKFSTIRPGSTEISTVLKGFEAGTSLEIEIWDFDFLSSNDLIGKFPIHLDEPGGPFKTDMVQNTEKTKNARYCIEWELDYL
jgi:hypothetical protein